MDMNAQFLHILIHRMLFTEAFSISDKKTMNLLQSLLTYEHSFELNKLGLCSLQSIAEQCVHRDLRVEALMMYH